MKRMMRSVRSCCNHFDGTRGFCSKSVLTLGSGDTFRSVEPGNFVKCSCPGEMEETGLEVRIKRLIGIYSDPASQVFCYPNGKNVHFVTSALRPKLSEVLWTVLLRSRWMLSFSPILSAKNILAMHPRWLADALCSNGAPLSGEYISSFSPLSRNRKGFPVV